MSNKTDKGWLEYRSDMNPDIILRIFKQDDGDMILALVDTKVVYPKPSIEFEACVPMSGGGKHETLWQSLIDLWSKEAND